MNKKTKIIIAIAAAILLVVSIIVAIVAGGKKAENKEGNATTNPSQTATTTVSSNEQILNNITSLDLIGVWYSDRADGDILTLSKDNTYSCSYWLNPGEFKLENKKLYLTDEYLSTKVFDVLMADDKLTLCFKDNSGVSYYFLDQKAAEASMASKEDLEGKKEDLQEKYTAVAKSLLVGEWKNEIANTHLSISDKEVVYTLDGEILETYAYTITKVEAKMPDNETSTISPYFTINVDVTKAESQQKVSTTFNIAEKGDSHSFDCAYFYLGGFTKIGELSTPVSVNDLPDEIAQQVPEGSKVTVSRTVRSSEEVDFTEEEKAKLADKISKDLIGTWKGCFDAPAKPTSIYWTYVFNQDGTYSFSDGTNVQKGTYVLTHNITVKENYPHILTLKVGSKETILKFYTTVKDNEYGMVMEDSNHPYKYIRQ